MNTEKGDLSADVSVISMLRFAYRYIFFRIYRWQLKQFGPLNTPEFVGASGVALLIWSNIVSILLLLKAIFGIDLLLVDKTLWIWMALGILLHVVTSYFFIFGKKYLLIAKEFEGESHVESWKRGLFVWGYTFFSVALFVVSILASAGKGVRS